MTEPLWWLTKDGDLSCLKMYERHYSAYQYQDGRKRKLFCGPGQKIVLRTWNADALFVWRKFIDASGETGVNCAVFPVLWSKLTRCDDVYAVCRDFFQFLD